MSYLIIFLKTLVLNRKKIIGVFIFLFISTSSLFLIYLNFFIWYILHIFLEPNFMIF